MAPGCVLQANGGRQPARPAPRRRRRNKKKTPHPRGFHCCASEVVGCVGAFRLHWFGTGAAALVGEAPGQFAVDLVEAFAAGGLEEVIDVEGGDHHVAADGHLGVAHLLHQPREAGEALGERVVAREVATHLLDVERAI